MTFDPNMSQRDERLTYYQLRPKSLRSSGAELDAECATPGSTSGMDEVSENDLQKALEESTIPKRGSR